jgi:hypothetical protein
LMSFYIEANFNRFLIGGERAEKYRSKQIFPSNLQLKN